MFLRKNVVKYISAIVFLIFVIITNFDFKDAIN